MSQHRFGGAPWLRGGVAITTTVALMLGIVLPAIAADTATFTGAVVGADNTLADKFTVVYKDAETGQEYRSGPTNSFGEYRVTVPVGGRYKLDSVVAPDGTKLAVQSVPPIRVTTAGSNRVDVRFTDAVASAEPAVPPAVPAEEAKKEDKGEVPWWKRPGPITGIVLGSLLIGALAYDAISGSDDDNASPSTPAD